jgi:rod shape-determining protein MreD
MTATPWRQMTRAERARWLWDHWKLGLPMLVVIAAYMAMTAPMFAPMPLMPNLALLLVLLWTLYRPQQMPDWTGFIAGFAGDVFLGTPIGANALLMPLFMVLTAAADRQVRRSSWIEDWLFGVPLVLLYHVALWRICAFAAQPIPFLPLLTQAAATMAVYPLAAHLFARAQRRWSP